MILFLSNYIVCVGWPGAPPAGLVGAPLLLSLLLPLYVVIPPASKTLVTIDAGGLSTPRRGYRSARMIMNIVHRPGVNAMRVATRRKVAPYSNCTSTVYGLSPSCRFAVRAPPCRRIATISCRFSGSKSWRGPVMKRMI